MNNDIKAIAWGYFGSCLGLYLIAIGFLRVPRTALEGYLVSISLVVAFFLVFGYKKLRIKW